MLFGNERQEIRQQFYSAWYKFTQQQPLDALEQHIVETIKLHPEYYTLLSDPANADHDYTPEHGQMNPFLHLGLHLAVQEQVQTNRPLGITELFHQLTAKHGTHEAEHRMMEQLGETLWEAQHSNTPPNEATYLEKVQQLL